jgi:hypothetical protein
LPGKGNLPDRRTWRITPTAHTSLFSVNLPKNISGAV